MCEKDVCHFVDSIFYEMEKTVIYMRIKGSQFFSDLDMGITVDQFTALDAVYCSKDICQRDLSKLILKDRSNTGRILNILEEKGFITRAVETKGNRLVKKIYITESGTKLVEDVMPKLKSAFELAFDNVPEEDFTHLRRILEKMKESLSKNITMQI